MVIIFEKFGADAAAPVESGGCLGGLGLVAPGDAGRAVAGILLVRVVAAAQAELAARVLPCLALAVPMEAKLGQLLPDLGGGRLFERHPNPFADNLGDAVNVGQAGEQGVQHLRGWQCPVLLPGFRVNGQAAVWLRRWRGCAWCCGFRCCRCRLGLMMGSVVEL